MNILAFDTCFNACSVAVGIEARGAIESVAERYEEMASGQAERLITMIAEVLAEAGITMAEVDIIAVTTGPGTFTGTRIGIAAAKGLALDRAIPVVGLSSLQVIAREIAFSASPHCDICVAVDVRRDELYVQFFDKSGLIARSGPALMTVKQLQEIVRLRDVILAGSGATLIAGHGAQQPLGYIAMPTALPRARYALDLLPPGTPQGIQPIFPLYLRAPDAKPSSAAPLQRQ